MEVGKGFPEIKREDTGILVKRDKFHNPDFYTYSELEEYGKQLVENFTKQTHFAYFGDLEAPPWGQLGFAGQHRDSDALDTSNHEVIRDSLMALDEEAFRVEGSSHWAVGWVDVIRVDTSNLEAVAAVASWRDALEDYPVADEEHFSNTEHEEDEAYYQYGGRDDAIKILEESGEFPELFDSDGDWIASERNEAALNDAFHRAMSYGDHTAIPEDYLPPEMAGSLADYDRYERVKYEEVQPPLDI